MKVKTNLDEILYDKIIESLLKGEYAIGDKIQIDELCEKYEVSRTPVVQAVKMLSKDGVLTSMRNGRIYVPQYEAEMVKKICDARFLFESYCVTQLIHNSNEEEFHKKIEHLKEYTRQYDAYLQVGDRVKMALIDQQFHRALVESAGNEILDELYTGIQGRNIIVNYLVRPMDGKDFNGTVSNHNDLVKAIESRNEREACECLKKHINNTHIGIN